MEYYECKTCGNVMVLFEDSGVVPVCCGSTMNKIQPLGKDGPKEKHVPVVEIKEHLVNVKVGGVLHPMTDDHYIKWIVLDTNKGKYIRDLKPGDEPIAHFCLQPDEKVNAVYSYCNIHSLWAIEL